MKLINRADKQNTRYTRIENAMLEDNRLSFKARGILAYILTKPDNWRIRIQDLVNHSSDGKSAVYSGIKELTELGYLAREDIRMSGKFAEHIIVVYENPNLRNHLPKI